MASSVDRLSAAGLLADLAGQVEPLECELDRARALSVVAGSEPVADLVVQLGLAQDGQPGQEVEGADLFAGDDHGAGLDGVDEQREVDPTEMLADRLGRGGAEQVLEDLALATLLAALELDLPTEHLDRALEVDDPGDRIGLALARRPVQSSGGEGLRAGDREPSGDARALVDTAGLAQVSGEPGQDLHEIVGDVGDQMRLLTDHCHLVVELHRVVGADLGTEPVLERGDDPAAVGVVLGVRAGDHEHVERQPQHVAADLDVALLHHVEHRDLDPLGEVGQLVDCDDSPVGPGDQAEMNGLGIPERTPLSHLHRVDVADQVGHGRVRGGELLGVPLVAVPPRDRQVHAGLLRPPPGHRGDRLVGVLGELRPVDDGRPLVEQPDEGAQQPSLALPALAEEYDVVAGQDRPLELRDHGLRETVQPGPRIATLFQGIQQVAAELLLEGLLDVARGAERPHCGDLGSSHPTTLTLWAKA